MIPKKKTLIILTNINNADSTENKENGENMNHNNEIKMRKIKEKNMIMTL